MQQAPETYVTSCRWRAELWRAQCQTVSALHCLCCGLGRLAHGDRHKRKSGAEREAWPLCVTALSCNPQPDLDIQRTSANKEPRCTKGRISPLLHTNNSNCSSVLHATTATTLYQSPHDEVVHDSSGLNCLSDHRRRRDLPDVQARCQRKGLLLR